MFSSLSRKRVFVLLILTSLLLITLDRRDNAVIDRARDGFHTALKPFDTAADAIAKPIARAWYGITNYDRLDKENEALRDQLDAQKGAEVAAKAVVYGYQAVLELYQLSKDYPHVMSRVTGPAPSNFQNTVEITVGANRGVKVGMPVLSNAGLIGKVTEVYADTAEVRLITDPSYSVAAEVIAVSNATLPDASTDSSTSSTTPSGQPVPDPNSTTTSTPPTSSVVDLTPPGNTSSTSSTSTTPGGSSSTTTTVPIDAVRETGTLQGQGNGKPILLRFVDDSGVASSIKVGDTVQTAGGKNDLAPEGLPIGTISKITQAAGSRTLIVEVEPNASLDRLYFVSVVLYSPGESAGG
ncbi:MAG: rod shape-determining protein MreC [Ilumatobacteraceae bacterium]